LVAALSTAAPIGWILYKTVIEPKQEGTTKAYLIGWGIVLPFWICCPFWLIWAFSIKNVLFIFVLGGAPAIAFFFRTLECIYGFCPEYVTKSAKDFCFYYATLPIAARVKAKNIDNNSKSKVGDLIPCSQTKKIKHLATFLGLLFITGALQSILAPHQYLSIFGMGGKNISWYGTERFFSWQLYANSALQAMLMQMYLATYTEALVLTFSVTTGFEAEAVMHNPLLKSESPMEFWGKRWNTFIHTVLKNGVYKPIRKFSSSRNTAVLATFLASGIFHEYLLALVFSTGDFQPIYGASTVFFVWQAMLIGLELFLGHRPWVRAIARSLPRTVRTTLLISSGIPLAHFFLDSYLRCDYFFTHGATALPMIVQIKGR